MPRSRNYLSFIEIIIGFIFLSTVVSCIKDESNCYTPTTVVARVQFTQRTMREIDTMIDGRPLDTTYIYEKDTILPYINAINLEIDTLGILGIPNYGIFTFYLNPNNTSTSYAIRYDTVGDFHDTIRIYHQSAPVFVSNDCGYTNYFTIDSIYYGSNIIDSMHIFNREITLDNTQNSRMANFYFFKNL